MTSFLSKLTDHILLDTQVSLAETAIIFPNRRAGRVMQKRLAEKIGKPFFSPTFFNINDFILSLSPLKGLSTQELLIELYAVFGRFEYAKDRDFESFLSWATTFLQDINDIDMQLVNAPDVFENLSNLRELQTSFGNETLSLNQQKYLQFYELLPELYCAFNDSLLNNHNGYEGLIYKDVSINVATYDTKHRFKRYIFAGLGVLSPAEYKIIQHYVANHQAELYFDFDTFYAEPFSSIIHQLKESFSLSSLSWISDDYATIPKEIRQVGVSKNLSQVLYAIDRINEFRAEGTLDETALVLADESLLLPFIHAYNGDDVNYTMGYPLSETPVYGLLQNIIEMTKNSYRFKEMQENRELLYYHKDVLTFFRNPLIKECFFTEESHQNYLHQIIASGKIFFKLDDLPHFPEKSIPLPMPLGIAFLGRLRSYFDDLLTITSVQSHFYPFLKAIHSALKELEADAALFPNGEETSLTTLEFFIFEKIRNISLPLKGDNNKGLQVMGLLETRTLDFKNIIFLSVNEGILPTGKKQNSLILYDIKRHFNLPTHQQKDIVYAYHFFRLLQRAEKVYLVYNQDSTDSLAEKSRFMNQLEFEIKRQMLEGNIRFITEQLSILPKQPTNQQDISVIKNQDILDKLYAKAYSASTLSQYINCPLEFYLSSIERIQPTKTISENIEHNVIGTILHGILEIVFSKIKENPTACNEIIKQELRNLSYTVHQAFADNEDIKGLDLEKGKAFLYIEIAKKNLKNYLTEVEKEYPNHSFQIIGIEHKFETTLSLAGKEIKLVGSADRIDRLPNGEVRILDYKTGKVETTDLKYVDMEELFNNSQKRKLFQLLMYELLYRKCQVSQQLPLTDSLSCAIVAFQKLNKKETQYLITPNQSREELILSTILEEFEEALKQCLQELLDPNIPFTQTSNLDNCKYCDYRTVCGK